MTEAEFDHLRGFLKARSGLALGPEKRYLVESRLEPLCRGLELGSIAALCGRLRFGRDAALETAVVEAMTTNETFFFRDRAPFDLFRDVLLPGAMAARAAERRLRIWCAAASSGQEPYSLAILLAEAGARLAGWRVDLVATDLSEEILAKARAGLYSHFEVQRGLPAPLLVRHFEQVGDRWRIGPDIRRRVDFRQLNLLENFAALGRFDIIYCRNVLIYFDAPTKAEVLGRMAGALVGDGALVLGAAETVIGLTTALRPDPARRGAYVHAASPAPVFAVEPRRALRLVAAS